MNFLRPFFFPVTNLTPSIEAGNMWVKLVKIGTLSGKVELILTDETAKTCIEAETYD